MTPAGRFKAATIGDTCMGSTPARRLLSQDHHPRRNTMAAALPFWLLIAPLVLALIDLARTPKA